MPNYNGGRMRGRAMMPEVMALNREAGPKAVPSGRAQPMQPMGGIKPQAPNAQKYAKGGKVMKHADEKQDKALIAKMIKASTGKKPIKRAAGGSAKVRKGVATQSGKPINQPKRKNQAYM